MELKMKELTLIFIYWFHLSSTVIWIGGIFFILFIVIPSAKKISSQEASIIMGYISKRFTSVANYSIVILILTGIILIFFNKNYTGIGNFNNTWILILVIKHIVVFLMIIIHFYRLLILSRKIANAPSPEKKTYLQKISLFFVKLNFTLGMTVLFLSGITSFF
jgi:uncharacterized membrane protein